MKSVDKFVRMPLIVMVIINAQIFAALDFNQIRLIITFVAKISLISKKSFIEK
jgi:hypothetical protein